MAFSIITIGKPGGCKSTANAKILYELTRLGTQPQLMSDRLLLEEAVLNDVHFWESDKQRRREKDQALEGDHSILFEGNKPPGHRVFQVKDGSLLNTIHDEMASYALFHDYEQGALLEYATGPNVELPGGVLTQSGQSLVHRFSLLTEKEGRKNSILVIEVDASLDERLRRNGDRVDGMRPETFMKFFPDGGELRSSGGALLNPFGIQYYFLDNDYNDLARFQHELTGLCDGTILPFVQEALGTGGLERRGRPPGFLR